MVTVLMDFVMNGYSVHLSEYLSLCSFLSLAKFKQHVAVHATLNNFSVFVMHQLDSDNSKVNVI